MPSGVKNWGELEDKITGTKEERNWKCQRSRLVILMDIRTTKIKTGVRKWDESETKLYKKWKWLTWGSSTQL